MHTLLWLALVGTVAGAEPLPGTRPLDFDGDPAAAMVAGIHSYLDRELTTAVEARSRLWRAEAAEPNRLRLRNLLGVVDTRVASPTVEYVAGPGRSSVVAEGNGFKVHAVRWPVLPGVDAEGLLLEPENAVGTLVVVPDAAWTPEMLVGLVPGAPERCQCAAANAANGYRVLIPTLIDRQTEWSGNGRLGKRTGQSHREFVHRMAFEMGRTLIGYEVQKVLAAVDWALASAEAAQSRRIGVIGFGEGGLIARLAAAVDDRVRFVAIAGQGGPAEDLWREPLERNLWGFLREFGTAELTRLIRPRSLAAEPQTYRDDGGERIGPQVGWPDYSSSGRGGAAPGRLTVPPLERVRAEQQRARRLSPPGGEDADGFVVARSASVLIDKGPKFAAAAAVDAAARQKRQFDQLVAFTQKLWRDSEAVRGEFFWKRADASSPERWRSSCNPLRDSFWTDVIGKLPAATLPPNPRTRRVYDEPNWHGYSVMLDVHADVFTHGVLLVPKDLKPDERRPVVVCQHGLEGTPQSCIDAEKRPTYNRFAAKLADLGYVVYCPQNPYKGGNEFRQIQRKANPLKLSLFSFIVRQHEVTLDWLATLPFVDSDRIAFYGLSYGGKTAMRVPAVLPRYCLSICSGDFNEWVGKCVSVDLDRSYMFTGEYEMYEFDLGHTFNYAEMAGLIAPRPFMVERGHDDPVGTDEMVAYEYAKVRRLYDKLGLGDRTAIEVFNGGHVINGKGTFEFLKRHLRWPR